MVKTSTLRQRKYRAKLKLALFALIGAECKLCGSKTNLSVDHLGSRTWSSREVWSDQRTKFYIEEAKLGLVQCLCTYCNSMKGKPEDDNF